jgi:hypothetical protein
LLVVRGKKTADLICAPWFAVERAAPLELRLRELEGIGRAEAPRRRELGCL